MPPQCIVIGLLQKSLNDEHNMWIPDIHKHYHKPPDDHQIGLAIMVFFKKRNVRFSWSQSLEVIWAIILSIFYEWRLDAYIKISAKFLSIPYHKELNI